MILVNLVGQRAVYFQPCVVARTASGCFHPMGRRQPLLARILGSPWIRPYLIQTGW